MGLSDEDQDTPIDYAIFSDPEFHNISSSPEDSGYEREINDWLMNFLVDDGLLTKINTMIESVRNKTKSTKD